MSKVAVIYWSGTGNTESMAKLLETGLSANGAEVVLMTPDDVDTEVVKSCTAVALGCPAMGNEVLEESEFEPMWADLKSSLSGKKIALFGSYDWGDGDWMNEWESEAKSASLNVVGTVISNLEPNDGVELELTNLAKELA